MQELHCCRMVKCKTKTGQPEGPITAISLLKLNGVKTKCGQLIANQQNENVKVSSSTMCVQMLPITLVTWSLHTHTQKLFILSLIAYITTVGAPNWLFLKEEKKVIKEEGLEEKKRDRWQWKEWRN